MFVILSLPRSRSAWLAHYLGHAGRHLVGHDIAIECNKMKDFVRSFDLGLQGTCETGAVVGWRLLLAHLPKAKFVTIVRPLGHIVDSLKRQGVELVPGEIETRYELLLLASQHPRVKPLAYDDLRSRAVCQWLFEYCLDKEWDEEWYSALKRINIQVDVEARIEQLIRRQPAIERLQLQIARETQKLGDSHGLH